MFNRLIDDVKLATGVAARHTFLIAAVAISLFVTTSFICAAAFVFVLQRYGLVYACLSGAAIFFVVTLISAGSYLALKTSATKRIKEDVKPVAASLMPDPMVLAAGLQVARAIGFKRLVPILAIAGVAIGILAARSGSDPQEGAPDEAEG